MDAKELAIQCAEAAYQGKARDIQILDVDPVLVITHYFVIATGDTRKHLQGICNRIRATLKKEGVRKLGLEGYEDGQWVLLDYGEVIVQLFDPESRARYGLETMWADAAPLEWAPSGPAPQDENDPYAGLPDPASSDFPWEVEDVTAPANEDGEEGDPWPGSIS
ncbi:MAG: ribosome silencing factor, partial [Planctomycetota bacterium]